MDRLGTITYETKGWGSKVNALCREHLPSDEAELPLRMEPPHLCGTPTTKRISLSLPLAYRQTNPQDIFSP